MKNKLRKVTRIIAIPLLVLCWILSVLQILIMFICCCLDFNLNPVDPWIKSLLDVIKDFWIKGAEGL